MSKKISRQRQWQIDNPNKATVLRAKTRLNQRAALLKQGYVRTHEEIVDAIKSFEFRNGKVDDKQWWLIYEYLDWKYNNSLICNGVKLRTTPREE